MNKTFTDEIILKFKELNQEKIDEVKNEILNIKKQSGTVFLFGNGASSSIADHLSVDLTKVNKIKSRSFNISTLITCYGNDYGFENIFTECIKSYVDNNDLCIFISSSGESRNVVYASNHCKMKHIKNITLTGFKKNNALSQTGNINIHVNSTNYNVIETVHQTILLSIVEDLKTS